MPRVQGRGQGGTVRGRDWLRLSKTGECKQGRGEGCKIRRGERQAAINNTIRNVCVDDEPDKHLSTWRRVRVPSLSLNRCWTVRVRVVQLKLQCVVDSGQ